MEVVGVIMYTRHHARDRSTRVGNSSISITQYRHKQWLLCQHARALSVTSLLSRSESTAPSFYSWQFPATAFFSSPSSPFYSTFYNHHLRYVTPAVSHSFHPSIAGWNIHKFQLMYLIEDYCCMPGWRFGGSTVSTSRMEDTEILWGWKI